MPKLIFFAGSARKDSLNKKLARAAEKIAKDLGAQTTYIDLRDYELPIFCEDIEAEHGMPEAAQKLKALFIEHDGFFIASPEYNSTFSPLLKNTLDWMSRGGADGTNCFKGKVTAIAAASPGPMGGLRGLPTLRNLLSNIAMHGTTVIPAQCALGNAHKAFDDNGDLKTENPFLTTCIKQLVETAEKLK
ncbi:MAG: NADPH-dependent FMN reductase [Alphaproteobacteria bacterium]